MTLAPLFMKITYNWLKEYIEPLPSPKILADKLTMAGLEVEGIETLDKGISGVVTAQILSVEKHPNADRLAFCKVKTDKGIHSIVCGAKNMKDGDKVALALPGAILPKGIKIEKTKIRGVESEGMMCSEVELGLKYTSEGIMILPQDFPIGKDFTEAMGLNDFILNINVTPNRPDCLSIFGIAREVSAIIDKPLKTDTRLKTQDLRLRSGVLSLVSIFIAEPSLCKRYTAIVIKDIEVKPSPDWLKQRLESVGYRSINNIVDITNYVMIEYGQPLHAFDYNLISDKQIIVRTAHENEKIQTLDSVERILTKEMLVIADKNKAVALAGIMGGKGTEIRETTKDILLESAYFDPSCVRRTSKILGLSTESSYRFERGIDIEGVTKALDKAIQMIIELASGKVETAAIDKYPLIYNASVIEVRLSKINKLIGVNIKKEEIEDYLNRLGFTFGSPISNNIDKNKEIDIVWNVTPPSFRVDISREIDIIEEIARMYGYENIPTTLPIARLSPIKTTDIESIRTKGRNILTNNSFLEAVNYSFISPTAFDITAGNTKNVFKLLNPLTEEQSLLRQSLIPSLLVTLSYNLNHNNNNIKIFEIGRTYINTENGSEEREMIGGLISGPRHGEGWNFGREVVDFYDIKGISEQLLLGFGIDKYTFIPNTDISFLQPGKDSVIEINGIVSGIVGAIHIDTLQRLDIKQPAYIFELDLHKIIINLTQQKKYYPLPKYPMIIRDTAMILNKDISFQKLYDTIKGLKIETLEKVNVFDVYYGKNLSEDKYSIALRFIYRSHERTLTDTQINSAHTKILETLKERFRIEIRGEEGDIK